MRKSVIGVGILTAIFGVIMLIDPETCIKTAVIVLGISGIINGIYNLTTFRKLIEDTDFRLVVTIRGVLGILIGIIAVILPLAFAGVLWTVMIYTLAVYLLIAAAMELFGILRIRSSGIAVKPFVIEAITSVVLAIVLFMLPAAIGLALVRILGVFCIISGIGFIFLEYRNAPLVVFAEKVDSTEKEQKE